MLRHLKAVEVSPRSRNLVDMSSFLSAPSSCFCPVDVDPDPDGAAPTPEIFLEELQAEVVELQQDGVVVAVEEIESIVEVQEVTPFVATPTICLDVPKLEEDNLIILSLNGDAVSLSNKVLGDAFKVAYNNLRPDHCSALIVHTSTQARRRLQDNTNIASTQETSMTVVS